VRRTYVRRYVHGCTVVGVVDYRTCVYPDLCRLECRQATEFCACRDVHARDCRDVHSSAFLLSRTNNLALFCACVCVVLSGTDWPARFHTCTNSFHALIHGHGVLPSIGDRYACVGSHQLIINFTLFDQK
jgi:hypothetical protein